MRSNIQNNSDVTYNATEDRMRNYEDAEYFYV